jgi:hypothetical protein
MHRYGDGDWDPAGSISESTLRKYVVVMWRCDKMLYFMFVVMKVRVPQNVTCLLLLGVLLAPQKLFNCHASITEAELETAN